MIKVKMLPHLKWFETGASGMHTVVRNYFKHLPDYDIELVDPQAKRYDVLAVHAGSLDVQPPKDKPVVSHLHGLYWTADYEASKMEYQANRRIVNILHYAKEITVPAAWVGETIQRDMRLTPHIVGHGVDWQDWQHNRQSQGYVLAYAKNRVGDICDNSFVPYLAKQFPDVRFLCTLAPSNSPPNVISLGGTVPYEEMKRIIQEAAVVLSPVKETFGLLTLEAMAAGKPILGINKGGNVDLVQHGTNGYLYDDDIAEGLSYCLEHAKTLGDNGRDIAKAYTWQRVCEQITSIYQQATIIEPPSVGVVIPVYNKLKKQVDTAIHSAMNQTFPPKEIIVIDDGSNPPFVENDWVYDKWIKYIRQENQGVAAARNNGIAKTTSKYICCLDSDDWLDPRFLETCVNELEANNSIALAFTGLTSHEPDGKTELSPGNPYWDYDKMLDGLNTVWTCNVFRRSVWERLGGYRNRYCPDGAGEEDAELWLRMGAYGYKAKKVTDEGLFHYSWKSGLVSGDPGHKMTDYRAWHPWVKDGHHPLASYATPLNDISHPIRQYDEPIISVIIPVGPGHEKTVIDALDSLEAQRFRQWEAIVIWDASSAIPELLHINYPYVKWHIIVNPLEGGSHKPSGASVARNIGVNHARAPFILFLDADDTLRPIDTLSKMLDYWNEYQAAIYTDYVGQAHIDDESAQRLQNEGRLESYNPKTGEAIIIYKRSEFDCRRALVEPTTIEGAYNWNLVTTLLPKSWHDAIGGFDEQMETLEDWDYWLRLAKAGYCFKHLPEQLVRYRLRAGERHIELDSAAGRQRAQSVLEYIRQKHEQIEVKDQSCGCGQEIAYQAPVLQVGEAIRDTMKDSDFVKAVYTGRRGNHHIVGAFVFSQSPELPSRRRGDGWVLYYGYADQGYECLVHKQDVSLMTGKWQVKPEIIKPVVVKQATLPPISDKPVESPMDKLTRLRQSAEQQTKTAFEPYDLTQLNAVTPSIAKRMIEAGLTDPDKIKEAGVKGLTKIKGIAQARAKAILKELE